MTSPASIIGKPVIVCADDFGLNDAACESTLELAKCDAISAVSCVVDGPRIARHASALRDAPGTVSVGLHFNLTEHIQAFLQASHRTWLLRAYVLRSLVTPALRLEILRQLDLFEALYSRPPAFVDGHEHIHQLPGIAEALLDALAARYDTAVAVRATVPRRYRGLKAQLVAVLGGTHLQDLLRARQVASNTDFAGTYDFSTRVPYGQRMRAWLRSIAAGGLIMCHPERPVSSAPARNAEHEFFTSAAWPALLKHEGIRLVPFVAHPGPAPSRSAESPLQTERLA